MGYYQQYPPTQPRRRRSPLVSCLVLLTVLIFLLLALGVAVIVFIRPEISKQAGNALGGQLEQQLTRQIEAQFGDETQIPPDFEGTVSISDVEINQYLAAHPEELAPADSASVRFVPGEIVADITAYGVSGQARTGLAVQNGRVVTVNPRIDGMLSLFLDAEQLARSLEDTLNNQFAQEGKQITAITVDSGSITATVASS